MIRIQGVKFAGRYEEALKKMMNGETLYRDRPYDGVFLSTLNNMISDTDLAKLCQRGAYGAIDYMALSPIKKVPLKQYAEFNGISPDTARQRAGRGAYQTAEKIGRDWFIDPREEHIDNRVKTGEYKNWRDKE